MSDKKNLSITEMAKHATKSLGESIKGIKNNVKKTVSEETDFVKTQLKDKHLVKMLSELSQVDVDAVDVYQDVLANIKDKAITDDLDKFKKDHLKHIDGLAQWVTSFGGSPAPIVPDLKGKIMSGYTKLRGNLTGIKGYLSALHSTELLSKQAYKKAVDADINNPELKKFLMGNLEDEKRHIEYVENALKKLD